MRIAIGGIALALAIFLALPLQDFIPPVEICYGARVLFVPLLFCYGALALPWWAMLILAALTGFICDLNYLMIVDGQVEIAIGWSIVYFVLLGLLSHGFQPAFQRGHWWIHIILAAVGTSLYLGLQYAMICLRRHEFIFNELVAWRIVAPGLIAAALAPLLHVFVVWVGHFLPDSRPARSRR